MARDCETLSLGLVAWRVLQCNEASLRHCGIVEMEPVGHMWMYCCPSWIADSFCFSKSGVSYLQMAGRWIKVTMHRLHLVVSHRHFPMSMAHNDWFSMAGQFVSKIMFTAIFLFCGFRHCTLVHQVFRNIMGNHALSISTNDRVHKWRIAFLRERRCLHLGNKQSAKL